MSEIWEYRPLIDDKQFSAISGTVVEDLPVTGKLSALILHVRWDNTAGGDNTLNPLELLTKIEVVHRGSELIKSFNGLQAAGIAWRRGKVYPFYWNMGNASSRQEAHIVIPFGREMYDPQYGVDLARLMNPQLKLEWNNAYGTSGDAAGAFSATAGRYSVGMLYAPDNVAFSNFIKTTEIYTWSITASATEYIDLPEGHPWPRMYLYHNCADRNAEYNIVDLILNINSGAWKPWDIEIKELMALDFTLFGSPRLIKYFGCTTIPAPLDVRSLFDWPWDSEQETQGSSTSISRLGHGITDPTIDIYNPAAVETKLVETGRAFGRLYTLPFDVPSMENLLNTSGMGRVELEVQAASAVGTTPTGAILLEELM